MTERERTIIRVAGLVVHACGFLWLIVALAGGPAGWAPGALAFVVGGAWGWGMVLAAASRDRADAEAARAREMRRHQGFTAAFDDEVEPVVAPPPGTGRIPTGDEFVQRYNTPDLHGQG
jgi:hypothetical protein